MSWWNAKCQNNHGEYEITFGTKYKDRAKAVEKVCQAIIDKAVKTPDDVAVVVRCKDCVNYRGFERCANGICDVDTVSKRAVCPDDYCSYGERKDNG